MQAYTETVKESAEFLHKKGIDKVDSMIVLGSGLSSLSLNGFELISTVEHQSIPGCVQPTAPSHAGEFRFYRGETERGETKTIGVCAGRIHLYEGFSAQQVCASVYMLNQLGAKELIITNAAGALNVNYQPGDVMLISDHINFTGHNPLIGQDDSFGMRFPDMSQAYNPGCLELAYKTAKDLAIELHSGVYAGVTGPSLETSAERRMLHQLGGDAVGMSTVMEVIAANHCSMKVLGLSAITNLALGDENQQPDTIETVLENAAVAGKKIKAIVEQILKSC